MRSPTRTLLCLAVFAAAAAQAEEYKDGVIYCKATVANSSETILSVYLPPTGGYVDYQGNPATVWNIGTVPAGGAADTFFSNEGPGAFQVKNDGTRAAFVYIVTGMNEPSGYTYLPQELYWESIKFIFGDTVNLEHPQPADTYENGVPYRDNYRLAVSTEVTGKVPNWRPLNWMYMYDSNNSRYFYHEFSTGETMSSGGGISPAEPCCSQYLTYLAPGETQLFDLKFWAPNDHSYPEGLAFVVVLQASEFRAWAHDM